MGISKGNKLLAMFCLIFQGLISQNTFDLQLGELGKDSIEEAAEWAVSYYDLIMLTERLDESLILLKDIWQLEFEDIVSFKAKDNSAAQIFGVEDLSQNLTVNLTTVL